MQSSLLRLAVALLTFGVGVGATMFWIAYRTPDAKRFEARSCYARRLPSPPPPMLPPPAIREELPLPPPPAPPTSSAHVPVSGGFINDKALMKPAPVYPSVAVVSKVSGMVMVRVLVDESGKVLSAKAISGAPLLREAAADAASQARFAPTVRGGEAVKVSGIVSYNFVLP